MVIKFDTHRPFREFNKNNNVKCDYKAIIILFSHGIAIFTIVTAPIKTTSGFPEKQK